MRGSILAVLAGLVLLFPAWGFSADPVPLDDERREMPSDEELAKATKIVRDVFAANFKAATTLPKKQELAELLVAEALKTADDPPGQCALFREARTLAVAAGDAKGALRALDEMARVFKFDELTVKSKTILALGDAGNKAASSPELAVAAFEQFSAAIRADDFELAKKLGQVTATVALKAKEAALAQRANKQLKELDALAEVFAKYQAAATTLKSNPDDADANLLVGQYLCFYKGDWETGLRNLAKGSDADLKALANQELGEPTDATDQVNLADGWWERGEKESAIAKPNLAARAAFWYDLALSRLTGLAKAKTEKRLAELASRSDAAPKPPTRWIRLLPLVNLKTDKKSGKWERERDALTSGSATALLELRYQPPEEYDLRYSFKRLKGKGGVSVANVVAKKHLGFCLGWYNDNALAGFEYFNNKPLKQGPSNAPFSLENGKKYDVLVQVRKTGVQASVDGKPVIEFKTDGSNITANSLFRPLKPQSLGLYTLDETIFYNVDVRDVTGKGVVLK